MCRVVVLRGKVSACWRPVVPQMAGCDGQTIGAPGHFREIEVRSHDY